MDPKLGRAFRRTCGVLARAARKVTESNQKKEIKDEFSLTAYDMAAQLPYGQQVTERRLAFGRVLTQRN